MRGAYPDQTLTASAEKSERDTKEGGRREGRREGEKVTVKKENTCDLNMAVMDFYMIENMGRRKREVGKVKSANGRNLGNTYTRQIGAKRWTPHKVTCNIWPVNTSAPRDLAGLSCWRNITLPASACMVPGCGCRRNDRHVILVWEVRWRRLSHGPSHLPPISHLTLKHMSLLSGCPSSILYILGNTVEVSKWQIMPS